MVLVQVVGAQAQAQNARGGTAGININITEALNSIPDAELNDELKEYRTGWIKFFQGRKLDKPTVKISAETNDSRKSRAYFVCASLDGKLVGSLNESLSHIWNNGTGSEEYNKVLAHLDDRCKKVGKNYAGIASVLTKPSSAIDIVLDHDKVASWLKTEWGVNWVTVSPPGNNDLVPTFIVSEQESPDTLDMFRLGPPRDDSDGDGGGDDGDASKLEMRGAEQALKAFTNKLGVRMIKASLLIPHEGTLDAYGAADLWAIYRLCLLYDASASASAPTYISHVNLEALSSNEISVPPSNAYSTCYALMREIGVLAPAVQGVVARLGREIFDRTAETYGGAGIESFACDNDRMGDEKTCILSVSDPVRYVLRENWNLIEDSRRRNDEEEIVAPYRHWTEVAAREVAAFFEWGDGDGDGDGDDDAATERKVPDILAAWAWVHDLKKTLDAVDETGLREYMTNRVRAFAYGGSDLRRFTQEALGPAFESGNPEDHAVRKKDTEHFAMRTILEALGDHHETGVELDDLSWRQFSYGTPLRPEGAGTDWLKHETEMFKVHSNDGKKVILRRGKTLSQNTQAMGVGNQEVKSIKDLVQLIREATEKATASTEAAMRILDKHGLEQFKTPTTSSEDPLRSAHNLVLAKTILGDANFDREAANEFLRRADIKATISGGGTQFDVAQQLAVAYSDDVATRSVRAVPVFYLHDAAMRMTAASFPLFEQVGLNKSKFTLDGLDSGGVVHGALSAEGVRPPYMWLKTSSKSNPSGGSRVQTEESRTQYEQYATIIRTDIANLLYGSRSSPDLFYTGYGFSGSGKTFTLRDNGNEHNVLRTVIDALSDATEAEVELRVLEEYVLPGPGDTGNMDVRTRVFVPASAGSKYGKDNRFSYSLADPEMQANVLGLRRTEGGGPGEEPEVGVTWVTKDYSRDSENDGDGWFEFSELGGGDTTQRFADVQKLFGDLASNTTFRHDKSNPATQPIARTPNNPESSRSFIAVQARASGLQQTVTVLDMPGREDFPAMWKSLAKKPNQSIGRNVMKKKELFQALTGIDTLNTRLFSVKVPVRRTGRDGRGRDKVENIEKTFLVPERTGYHGVSKGHHVFVTAPPREADTTVSVTLISEALDKMETHSFSVEKANGQADRTFFTVEGGNNTSRFNAKNITMFEPSADTSTPLPPLGSIRILDATDVKLDGVSLAQRTDATIAYSGNLTMVSQIVGGRYVVTLKAKHLFLIRSPNKDSAVDLTTDGNDGNDGNLPANRATFHALLAQGLFFDRYLDAFQARARDPTNEESTANMAVFGGLKPEKRDGATVARAGAQLNVLANMRCDGEESGPDETKKQWYRGFMRTLEFLVDILSQTTAHGGARARARPRRRGRGRAGGAGAGAAAGVRALAARIISRARHARAVSEQAAQGGGKREQKAPAHRRRGGGVPPRGDRRAPVDG